jgi:hypothetical protein
MQRSCMDILIVDGDKFSVGTHAASNTEPLDSCTPGGMLLMHESQIDGCYSIME